MKLQKRLAVLLTAACLMLAVSVTAYAHEAVDMNRTGSVSVTMKYNESIVSGGTLMLYKVGEVCENDGNYSFALTDEFKNSNGNLALEDMDDSALAKQAAVLAAYASAEKLPAKTIKIGSDGTATAGGLQLGLYLAVQTEAAKGYEAVAPFLVSVPMNEDGHYLYDVDATPKMSLLTEAKPDKPTEPGRPTTPDKPSESKLPQTGQLNWPVPVMAALGLCLLMLGMALRTGRKGETL